MYDNPGWYAYLIDDDCTVIAHGYISPRVASGEPGFAFNLRCLVTQPGSVKGAIIAYDGEVIGHQPGVVDLDGLKHGERINFDIVLYFNTIHTSVSDFLAAEDVAFEDA